LYTSWGALRRGAQYADWTANTLVAYSTAAAAAAAAVILVSVQVVAAVMPLELKAEFYNRFLKGRLQPLANHHSANFVVQAWMAACSTPQQVGTSSEAHCSVAQ
jgi:hypothetical protein